MLWRRSLSPLLRLFVSNFDSAAVARGRGYLKDGLVTSVKQHGSGHRQIEIQSAVRGSSPEPYEQSITVDLATEVVRGDCTCPVGRNCKHVAAVLMTFFDDQLDKRGHQQVIMPIPASAPTRLSMRTQSAETPLPYDIESWLLELARAGRADEETYPADVAQRMLYVFEPAATKGTGDHMLVVHQARVLKNGQYSAITEYTNTNVIHSPPRFVLSRDLRILRELLISGNRGYGFRFSVQTLSGQLIADIIATQRAHWRHVSSPPLKWGVPRAAEIDWEIFPNGDRRPRMMLTTGAMVFASSPPTYLDTHGNEAGNIETKLTPAVASIVAAAPVLPASLVGRVSQEMQRRHLHQLIAPPAEMEEVVLQNYAPKPVLVLNSYRREYLDTRTWRQAASFIDTAALKFEYLDQVIAGKSPTEITRVDGNRLTRVFRNNAFEKAARAQLRHYGLDAAEKVLTRGLGRHALASLVFPGCENEAVASGAWTHFVEQKVPALRTLGWRVVMKPDFRFDVVKVDEWYANVDDAEKGWFDLEIGIEVEGQRISLIPILIKMIRNTPGEWQKDALAVRHDNEHVLVPLPDGRRVALSVGRVRPLVTTLYELFLREAGGPALRLSALEAGRLAEMEGAIQCRWFGGETLRALGARLARFVAVEPVATPKNFQAELRPYQAEGLAWLQFLREYDLAGVLADDMGLGKTVQTLAHIVCEKQAGRLGAPALVVAPTSMIGTWQAEAKRFAPSLSVWVSHGGRRHDGAENMSHHDVVLTSYALLARDAEILKKTTWHLLILDEAQNIKNPKTHAAVIACTLPARHRLCLSGTPLENHLGELWSLFQFLMPGFLGDEKSFQRDYRRPIEKDGDSARRQFLARRIKPFMLRRTKDMVAGELPPKTFITRTVEMDTRQSDLYETIRAAMDKRVREEIASKGLARSHIVVLDALLKLRQVCSDPRLLKSVAAKNTPSAKLEALLEMLNELLEEGRHILLFSQFTSMLTLIEAELDKRQIKYAKLTGSTRDRVTPIDDFQSGRVKLFLISLKAGGTGLTLTAADTVIHYDPWWNPAVENQATDRAHRIGQSKPVFVYKLITKDTVEERIVELQSRKGALASALLGGEAKAVDTLAAEDLKALFEPLPLI